MAPSGIYKSLSAPPSMNVKRGRPPESLNLAPTIYISPREIYQYTICPFNAIRLVKENLFSNYSYDRGKLHDCESDNTTLNCMKDVIKAAFVLTLRRDSIPSWNRIRTSIGLALKFRASRKLPIPTDIEQITELIWSFYSNYLTEVFKDALIYPNIPIDLPIGRRPDDSGIVYKDTVHALGIHDDKYFVIDFRSASCYTKENFLNDQLLQYRIWAVKQSLGEFPSKVIVLYFDTLSAQVKRLRSFTYTYNSEEKELLSRYDKNIIHIIQSITNGIDYKNPECKKDCSSFCTKRKS